MPETIGFAIVEAIAASGEAEALVAFAEGSYLGISGAAAIGGATIIAASIGLQLALRPNVPSPEAGSTPIKQAVPPRYRGYWNNRLAGFYMLFFSSDATSYDVLAFHHGKVERINQVYLDDDAVGVTPDISGGGGGIVGGPGGRYGSVTEFIVYMGEASQVASTFLTTDPATSGFWTSDFRGDGIAYMLLICNAPGNSDLFQNTYPRGVPSPSVVARCTPLWDPRDPAQDRSDSSTWLASPNPVLQMLDYKITPRIDGGQGYDFNEIFPDDVLAQWMVEADLCDDGDRYQSAGFYRLDNNQDDVEPKMLATCDGWMAEQEDGTFVLTVGVYREPSESALTEKNILGFVNIKYGTEDEKAINKLDITITDPASAYSSKQIDSVRDEASIALLGEKPKPLDLSWVQDEDQATLLGQRAMLRVNPQITGTLITDLYGLIYRGKRWVKVQYAGGPRGLEDCVVEIQDGAEFDLLGGTVTLPFILVDPVALAAL
jgi:hypothetical protein